MKMKIEKKKMSNPFSKRVALTIFSMMLCISSIFAQSKTITGKVLDSTDEPLIGVSVVIKGTTTGTVTDFDGAYSITANTGDQLEFTFLGMNTQVATVGESSVINIVLQENATMLAETVVIGYGSAKAKDLTSPIVTVSPDELNKHLTASPMQALQGKVAGVQIVNSGQPGSSPTVRIRGVSNYDSGKQGPLYVVDGMFFDDIAFLSNNDIESMSILKDASSAAIYGVRAANGVIIITTKKGIPNRKPQIVYDGYVGFQRASNILKMANSEQYTTMIREGNDTGLIKYLDNSIALWGGENGVPATSTDWYDELLRTALIQNHGVNINGGGENMSYAVGVNYLYQEGLMDMKNDFERINTRARIDANFTNWLKGGANIIITNSTQNTNSGNAWLGAYHNPSIYPVYDENNNKKEGNPYNFASPQQIGLPTYFWNPVGIAKYSENQRYQKTHVLPSFYLEGNFLNDRLSVRSAYSQDLTFLRYRQFIPEFNVGGNQSAESSYLQKRSEFNNNWIWDNTITFRESFGKHNLTAMVGASVRQESWELLRIEGNDVPEGKEEYWYIYQGIQSANSKTNFPDDGAVYRGSSYFGRVMYDFAGKYFLSATMRADGSSKYQKKWGYFPSLGAAWTISEENFMKEQKIFDHLKLRATWGKLGNDKIQANDGFASITPGEGIFDDQSIPGYTSVGFFSYLKWEEVEEYDLGFDFTVLNNRLSGSFDYYNRQTNDAVFSRKLSFVSPALLVNRGKIGNRGIDVALNWNDVIGKEFKYNIGFNLSTMRNRVLSLDGIEKMDGGNNTIRMIGQPVDAFYGYKVIGVYQNQDEINTDPIAVANNLKPGDFKYQDTDGDGALTATDRVILGSHLPKLTLGGNIGFDYKNIDFSLAFQGQFGHKIFNKKRSSRQYQSALNYDAEWAENRWTGEGSTNEYPSAAGSNNPWNIGKMNSFFVEDGSYFSIQNIQLGYTFVNILPNNGNKSSLRLSLTAERPFNFFSYNGFTSDIAGGIDENVYPLASTYSFGVKFTF